MLRDTTTVLWERYLDYGVSVVKFTYNCDVCNKCMQQLN